jgi:hypothetical protein
MQPKSVVPLRIGAVVLAVLGIFPLAVVIKYAPVVQWVPVAAIEWLVAVPALLGICLAVAHLLGSRADTLLDRGRALLLAPSPRDFAAWSALAVLALSLFFAWYCFGGRATSGDEMSQRFQVRLLLHGRLSAVVEPHLEFFGGTEALAVDGRWFSQFPIGGAILLALGAAVNAVWLVNPALAAWTAVSFYRFASRTMDEATARAATLLFVFSPGVVLMSATQMNHTGALALLMFALAWLPEWATSDNPRRIRRAAVCIGLGVASLATIRPYDAVLVAAVIGIFQLSSLRDSPVRQRSLVWQFLTGLLPLAVLLIANWQTTGHPLLFGYDALNGLAHRPGFHVDPTGNDFTPLQGLHHISSYLLRLNFVLFAGPLPGLVMVVVALMLVRTATRWDYLLLGIIGALCVGYASYWAESFMLGMPRFLYVGFPAFILFAARMPGVLASRLNTPTLRRAALLIVPASVAVAWLLPPRGPVYIGAWRMADLIRGPERELAADIEREINEGGLTDALVFVHDSWHGRLSARLRALGAPALTAESMVTILDACVLQRALDEEDSLSETPSIIRVRRVVVNALSAGNATPVMSMPFQVRLAFVGGMIPQACLPQLDADRAGTTPLEPFLQYDDWAADGRLGGRVVFARDFGLRNNLLLSRFGDRTWYRYRPRTGAGDTSPLFVPYFRGQ